MQVPSQAPAACPWLSGITPSRRSFLLPGPIQCTYWKDCPTARSIFPDNHLRPVLRLQVSDTHSSDLPPPRAGCRFSPAPRTAHSSWVPVLLPAPLHGQACASPFLTSPPPAHFPSSTSALAFVSFVDLLELSRACPGWAEGGEKTGPQAGDLRVAQLCSGELEEGWPRGRIGAKAPGAGGRWAWAPGGGSVWGHETGAFLIVLLVTTWGEAGVLPGTPPACSAHRPPREHYLAGYQYHLGRVAAFRKAPSGARQGQAPGREMGVSLPSLGWGIPSSFSMN